MESRQEIRLGQKQTSEKTEGPNRTKQNNKRADRKMESNDSPEIPDRGEDRRRVAFLRAPKHDFMGGF